MFKKFTLVLCFMACAVTAMSQVSAADSLQLDINRIVAPLDKSQVPTMDGRHLLPASEQKLTSLKSNSVADGTWRMNFGKAALFMKIQLTARFFMTISSGSVTI